MSQGPTLLAAIRQMLSASQGDIASVVGYSQGAVSLVECRATVSPELLQAIAAALTYKGDPHDLQTTYTGQSLEQLLHNPDALATAVGALPSDAVESTVRS